MHWDRSVWHWQEPDEERRVEADEVGVAEGEHALVEEEERREDDHDDGDHVHVAVEVECEREAATEDDLVCALERRLERHAEAVGNHEVVDVEDEDDGHLRSSSTHSASGAQGRDRR